MNIWKEKIEYKPTEENIEPLIKRSSVGTKKCTKCHKVKNEKDFYDRGTGMKDSFCKDCRRKMNLARYYKKKGDVNERGI